MITLRLFRADDPFRQVDSRLLSGGELTIGRDPAADWVVTEGDCELSRRHCVIGVRDGSVWLRDTSTNGVFIGVDRQRVAREQEFELPLAQTVHLGRFLLVIEGETEPANDAKPSALGGPFDAPMLRPLAIDESIITVRSDWTASNDLPPPRVGPVLPDAALLEAFCAGAGLDPSYFAGEEPAEIMRRAGAMYRQTVLGVADLMSHRSSAKSAYHVDRTTVGAAENNPFKWTEAHRLAIDLLRPRHAAFLAGPAALKESFEDLKRHLLCLLAGSRAAVAATLEELDPQNVEEGAAKALGLTSKAKACWTEYQARHGRIATEAVESTESIVNRSFKAGYERQLRQLDDLGTCA